MDQLVDVDQQNLRIEDEDERQDRRAHRIDRALKAGRDRILLEIAAAANAASPTGGVMSAMMPK